MKQYYQNPRYNKVAFILAMMSPDLVEDIVTLANDRGQAVVSDLFSSDDEGPARPLAIFSEDYISDLDAPPLVTGISAILLASFKQIKGDAEFYQGVLQSAFALPKEIAGPMSKKIETYDILGGPNAKDTKAWYERAGMQLQEGVRRGFNLLPQMFNSTRQNDQTQEYDIDFLYEAKLFGEGVDEMMSRVRLMKGQANIARQMGFFVSVDTLKGDVYGDVYGDPSDIAELVVADAMKPLMGFPLPLALFGGLKKLFKGGLKASNEKMQSLANTAGVTPGSTVKDSELAGAFAKMMSGDNSSIVGQLAGQDVTLGQMKKSLELIKVARQNGETGDVYGEIFESYGDVAAEHWRGGNMPGLLDHLVTEAASDLPTTGDPELDEAIIADVLNDSQFGDVEDDYSPEIGGLLRKVRINRAIKRGKRRQRKAFKKDNKQLRKDAQASELAQAKAFANTQRTNAQRQRVMAPPPQVNPNYYEGDYEQPAYNYQDDFGGQQPQFDADQDLEVNPNWSNDQFDNQDDFYNTNMLN